MNYALLVLSLLLVGCPKPESEPTYEKVPITIDSIRILAQTEFKTEGGSSVIGAIIGHKIAGIPGAIIGGSGSPVKVTNVINLQGCLLLATIDGKKYQFQFKYQNYLMNECALHEGGDKIWISKGRKKDRVWYEIEEHPEQGYGDRVFGEELPQ